MVKQRKSVVVPRLRFPEFRLAGAWRTRALAELADFVNEKVSLSEVSASDYVSTENLLPSYGGVKTAAKLPTTDSVTRYHVGDVLISNIRPYLRKIWQADQSGGASNDVIVVRTKGHVFADFLAAVLRSDAFVAYVMSGARGVKMPRGDIDAIRQYPVSHPEAKEQQKIANCLTSLDEVIAARGRKVEALKTHKHALMQQLFPGEGETVPRLRFPEFLDDADWMQTTLGDVADIRMCKRIFASETDPHSGVPFYKIGTLGGVPDAFISRKLFQEYRETFHFPRVSEVLITCSGTVGKCLQYDGEDAYFQDSNIVWIDNPRLEVTNEFLLCLLTSVDWGQLNSTTITRIYGPDLRGLAIKFPQGKTEQARVSDYVTSLRNQIFDESRLVAALKAHRTGLMQHLFPSPEPAPA